MDRVKAIKVLKPLVDSYVDYANISMKEEDDDIADALEMAIEALKAPEIIQCKDCKHWDTECKWSRAKSRMYYCLMVDGNRESDFYCADAERRTDG